MSNLIRMFGQMANSAMTSAADAQKQREQAYNRQQARNYSPYKPNMGRQSVEEYNMGLARKYSGLPQQQPQQPQQAAPKQDMEKTKQLIQQNALRSKPYLRKYIRG